MQLRITLAEVKPAVWRRIVIPANYTFWDLHVAIQDAMGWLDCHLHLFRLRDPVIGRPVEIGIPNEYAFEDDPESLAGWEVRVAAYLCRVGARAHYEYDFGDGWVHEVKLEAFGPRQKGVKYPQCIGGKRACPPEDCGGPWGYAELLETIANPADSEYESTLEWLGGAFDPAAFDPAQVRFANPRRRWRRAFLDE
jgi:hypothetical protein